MLEENFTCSSQGVQWSLTYRDKLSAKEMISSEISSPISHCRFYPYKESQGEAALLTNRDQKEQLIL